jgi:molybdopterin adenylyltransferase
MLGSIIAVCISKNRGEQKKNVGQGFLVKGLGLEGDAHAGFGHRQVSILADESVAKMRQKGLEVGPGDFAENLTVAGITLPVLPIGTRLKVGKQAIVKVTQIGKQCHHDCEVYRKAGECVMPQEGIFVEVLFGGEVKVGDQIQTIPTYQFGIITVSDSAAGGKREDQSGPLMKELLLPWGEVVDYRIIPDEQSELVKNMLEMVDEQKVALLLTSGGTGFSPRDVTPEATMEVIDRVVPGIPEVMRLKSMEKNPRAVLSRAVAGIRGKSLLINLPGSPRGVRENLELLYPIMDHALEIVSGRGGECGN